jgi:dTDP-4-amino-4,6-dideoxygalactose transaminase
MVKEIPGVNPAAQYEGCTRNAYHLYMFRTGVRDAAIQALNASRLPASRGYSPLNKQPFITASLKKQLPTREVNAWVDRSHCPENDRLCEQAVWFPQTFLLGPRSDMERAAETARKVSR